MELPGWIKKVGLASAILLAGGTGAAAIGSSINQAETQKQNDPEMKTKTEEITEIATLLRGHNLTPAFAKEVGEYLDSLRDLDFKTYRGKIHQEETQQGGQKWVLDYKSKDMVGFAVGTNPRDEQSVFQFMEIQTGVVFDKDDPNKSAKILDMAKAKFQNLQRPLPNLNLSVPGEHLSAYTDDIQNEKIGSISIDGGIPTGEIGVRLYQHHIEPKPQPKAAEVRLNIPTQV